VFKIQACVQDSSLCSRFKPELKIQAYMTQACFQDSGLCTRFKPVYRIQACVQDLSLQYPSLCTRFKPVYKIQACVQDSSLHRTQACVQDPSLHRIQASIGFKPALAQSNDIKILIYSFWTPGSTNTNMFTHRNTHTPKQQHLPSCFSPGRICRIHELLQRKVLFKSRFQGQACRQALPRTCLWMCTGWVWCAWTK